MPEFTGKYIDIFMTVADALNFSKVASQRGLTRAQVGKQIAQFEKQLGVTLFYRTTRTMRLTPAGKQLYESVQPYYQQVKNCVATLRNETELIDGLIRMNVPFSFGLSQMMGCIGAFNQVHPNIHIDLVLGSFYEQALAGSFDVSIVVKDALLSKRPHVKIATRSSKVCASPGYLKKNSKVSSPKDLISHQCLVYANPGEQRNNWFFTKNNEAFKIKVSGPLQANSSSALLQAALYGMGVAKLPSFIVDPYLRNKKLTQLLPDYNLKENGIYAVFPQGKDAAMRCQLWVDFMQNYFQHTELD